jgi:uncharacterized protein (DUF305 family)
MQDGYGTSAVKTSKTNERVAMRTRIVYGLLLGTVLLVGCGTTQPGVGPEPTTEDGAAPQATPATAAPAATATGEAAGMGHGAMANGDAPYDALFIDSMIMHHEGAITMANQALQEAERPEIKILAEAIVKAQEAEIVQLKAWRQSWFPDLAATEGMSMDMGDMEISSDATRPFDQRFIEAMIPHHEGAIAMAKDAQQRAEHQEIRDLAQTIITAQEGEIAQMRQWQQAWFAQ